MNLLPELPVNNPSGLKVDPNNIAPYNGVKSDDPPKKKKKLIPDLNESYFDKMRESNAKEAEEFAKSFMPDKSAVVEAVSMVKMAELAVALKTMEEMHNRNLRVIMNYQDTLNLETAKAIRSKLDVVIAEIEERMGVSFDDIGTTTNSGEV